MIRTKVGRRSQTHIGVLVFSGSLEYIGLRSECITEVGKKSHMRSETRYRVGRDPRVKSYTRTGK
jgi:hypothetical protein